jgi:hypothetical protein
MSAGTPTPSNGGSGRSPLGASGTADGARGGARRRAGPAENRAAWAADLRQSLPVLRRLRLPATLWAYTHGGAWRLQPGEGPALYPEFRGALDG